MELTLLRKALNQAPEGGNESTDEDGSLQTRDNYQILYQSLTIEVGKAISGKGKLYQGCSFILHVKYSDKSLFGGLCRRGMFQKKKWDQIHSSLLQNKAKGRRGQVFLLQDQVVRG